MTNNELLQSFTVLLDQKFDQKFAEQELRIKDLLDESFEANNQYLLNFQGFRSKSEHQG